MAGEAARTFLGVDLPLAGSLPDDPALAAATGDGRSPQELPGGTPCLEAADWIVGRWLEARARALRAGADLIPLRPR